MSQILVILQFLSLKMNEIHIRIRVCEIQEIFQAMVTLRIKVTGSVVKYTWIHV